MTSPPHEIEYREASKVLIEYGGLVAPMMLGGEWSALLAFCRHVSQAPPLDDRERGEVESRINELVENGVFHPNFRAYLIYRALAQPPMQPCSHLLERATFHYYKRDFLSCVLVLLPAVEGILRSYVGWSSGQLDPKGHEVRDRLRAGTAESYPELRSAYAEALAAFHERWFWTRTVQADFRLSHLNRHYALHALGTETFYRAIDCHRLFLYFDTFAEMLTLEGQSPKEIFVPLEEPVLARRRDYYFRLVVAPPSALEASKAEAELLGEHPFFSVETQPPSLGDIAARFAKTMAADGA
jgi:hypothetical protein